MLTQLYSIECDNNQSEVHDELEKLRLKMEADNVKDEDVDAVTSLLGKSINYTELVQMKKQETGLLLANPDNHDKSTHLRALLN